MDNDLKKQSEQLINNLNIIKHRFIENAKELEYSIRKDIVAVELKEILNNSITYEQLKEAIQLYIEKLYKKDEDKNDE